MLGKYYQRIMIAAFPGIEKSGFRAKLLNISAEPTELEKSHSGTPFRKHPGARAPHTWVLVSLLSQGAERDVCWVAGLATAPIPPPGAVAHIAPRRYDCG